MQNCQIVQNYSITVDIFRKKKMVKTLIQDLNKNVNKKCFMMTVTIFIYLISSEFKLKISIKKKTLCLYNF